jgi:hypothetical protein
VFDGSIVNVALPAIERDLGGGLSGQQWVSNAYLLSLGSLICSASDARCANRRRPRGSARA